MIFTDKKTDDVTDATFPSLTFGSENQINSLPRRKAFISSFFQNRAKIFEWSDQEKISQKLGSKPYLSESALLKYGFRIEPY